MPSANQRVGEYLLIDRIGQGAFGEVWRGRHHAWADQIVAIKIPTDPQYVRNLQKEGDAVHSLSHPNIVKAIAFDPFADPAYFVMEFVPGSNLRPLIQRGPMQPKHAAAVMQQVLAALHHAHKHGVIHRDIKPENILIHKAVETKGFANGLVKLTDFGLGKVAAQSVTSIMMSQDRSEMKQIVGSAQYMSPEQRDGKDVDARSDLYACGVVLFEMLTGHRPEGTELPSDVNPQVPKALDEVFRRAFARLERRFSSAEEFFAALKQAVAEPIAKPAPLPQVVKQTPPLIGAEIAGTYDSELADLAAAVGQSQAGRIQPLYKAPQERTVPRIATRKALLVGAGIAGTALLVLVALLLWQRPTQHPSEISFGRSNAEVNTPPLSAQKVQKQQEIDAEARRADEMKKRAEQLKEIVKRLEVERRVADIVVTDHEESAGVMRETLLLVEYDQTGKALPGREFVIQGRRAHIDAMVIKFDGKFVEDYDPLRNHRITLFNRLYDATQTPANAFPIDQPGNVPDAYRSPDQKVSAFEQELWNNFWKLADDPAYRKSTGVHVAQSEGVWRDFDEGYLYTLTVETDGGLNITNEPLKKKKLAETAP